MKLKDQVLEFLRGQDAVRSGATIILGVSAGADSVAMAQVMAQLRHVLSLKLYIAHFNHRLRKTSDQDEIFVERLSAKLQMPFLCERRKKRDSPKRVSEDTARQWRHRFFRKVFNRVNARAIMLAHTQDDLAETVLMRLIRGSGIYGLRAILPRRDIAGMTILRSLIGVSRSSIEAYIRQEKLQFRTDESNLQTYYLRNRIRLSLLPLLAKEYNAQIHRVLVDMAKTAVEDYDFLQNQLKERVKENLVCSQRKVRINMPFFNREPASMQRLLLRNAYEHLHGDTRCLNFSHIVKVQEFAAQGKVGVAANWPLATRVVFGKKQIIVSL